MTIGQILWLKERGDIIISCKWQQVSGTAEQKILYEIASLIKIIEESKREEESEGKEESKRKYEKAYVVIGGGGFSKQAKEYLISQKFKDVLKNGELVEVLDTDEMISKINRKDL